MNCTNVFYFFSGDRVQPYASGGALLAPPLVVYSLALIGNPRRAMLGESHIDVAEDFR
jgi:hypothetical protein